MFINDVLAGMVLVISLLLAIVAIVAYRRYRLKAMLFNSVVFILIAVNMVLYALNALWNLGMDMIMVFLAFYVVILFSLYFAISLKG